MGLDSRPAPHRCSTVTPPCVRPRPPFIRWVSEAEPRVGSTVETGELSPQVPLAWSLLSSHRAKPPLAFLGLCLTMW